MARAVTITRPRLASADCQLVYLKDADEKHTAENLAALLRQLILSLEMTLDCKVSAIVSDAASNMVFMRNKVQATRGDVHYSHCQAHQLNLCLEIYLKDAGSRCVWKKN